MADVSVFGTISDHTAAHRRMTDGLLADAVLSAAVQCIVIPFATNLYVRAVGAFIFCVGLAWLAR